MAARPTRQERPTREEVSTVYAVGQRLKDRLPHAPYAEQLDYLAWVADLLERTVATSPSPARRRAGRRELAALRYAQMRLAREAQEQAREVVHRVDSERRRAALRTGGGHR